jgi:hypothetical protein
MAEPGQLREIKFKTGFEKISASWLSFDNEPLESPSDGDEFQLLFEELFCSEVVHPL